jgi:MFS transporter, DHA2 family, lincomycin resistance protein
MTTFAPEYTELPPLSKRDWATLLTLLISTFVMILNETIMNVALPQLISDLHVTAATVQWLSTGYLLVLGILIPTTGFLMQRFPTRTLFLASMGLFSLGTLIAAAAPNFAVVLTGRVVQASGTAVMLPLLISVVLALVPVTRRGSMLGTVNVVISVAPAVGPTVSGLILQHLPWPYLFVFVLPIALGTMLYGARTLNNVGETRSATLDVPSVALAALGFAGVLYGLSSAGEGDWAAVRVLVPLAVGGLSLAIFAVRQLRLPDPLLNLRAFRFPMFSLSAVTMMGMMVALFAAAVVLPLYLQSVRGLAPLSVGLLLLPGGVMLGAASPFVGRLFDRYGPVPMSSLGALLLAVPLWRFTTFDISTPIATVVLMHVTLHLGLALVWTPTLTTGLNVLPPALYPHGSAIISTLQQVAGAVGIALLIAVFTTTSSAALHGMTPTPEARIDALTLGFRSAFALALGVTLVTLLLTLFLRQSRSALASRTEQVSKPAS